MFLQEKEEKGDRDAKIIMAISNRDGGQCNGIVFFMAVKYHLHA